MIALVTYSDPQGLRTKRLIPCPIQVEIYPQHGLLFHDLEWTTQLGVPVDHHGGVTEIKAAKEDQCL